MASPGTDNGWRSGVSVKRYRCCQCGALFHTSTNHWGTIYRGCNAHYYGGTSECVEAEEFLKQKAKEKQR